MALNRRSWCKILKQPSLSYDLNDLNEPDDYNDLNHLNELTKSKRAAERNFAMTQEFDARKSYLAVKASEKMVAFVGFIIPLEENGKTKEGVVKIS